jgi:magnesium-transporting ATPase (P-type)
VAWHVVPGDEVLARQRGPGAWQVLLRQFTRPLIYALLASAAAFALCDVLEGVVVLAVVVLDERVGSVQEYRAGRAVEELDVLGRRCAGEQCQPAQ